MVSLYNKGGSSLQVKTALEGNGEHRGNDQIAAAVALSVETAASLIYFCWMDSTYASRLLIRNSATLFSARKRGPQTGMSLVPCACPPAPK